MIPPHVTVPVRSPGNARSDRGAGPLGARAKWLGIPAAGILGWIASWVQGVESRFAAQSTTIAVLASQYQDTQHALSRIEATLDELVRQKR